MRCGGLWCRRCATDRSPSSTTLIGQGILRMLSIVNGGMHLGATYHLPSDGSMDICHNSAISSSCQPPTLGRALPRDCTLQQGPDLWQQALTWLERGRHQSLIVHMCSCHLSLLVVSRTYFYSLALFASAMPGGYLRCTDEKPERCK